MYNSMQALTGKPQSKMVSLLTAEQNQQIISRLGAICATIHDDPVYASSSDPLVSQ